VSVVTTPRSDVMYVVTEYGMVNLKGKSVPERATAMISIAHPDFRDELERPRPRPDSEGLRVTGPRGLSMPPITGR
jgi:acyl-CoA hydrolase